MTNSNEKPEKMKNKDLEKFVGGNNFVEWLERFRKDLTESSVQPIKLFGPDLLTRLPISSEVYNEKYLKANKVNQRRLCGQISYLWT